MKVLMMILLISSISSEELTPENVYNYCIEKEIQHPEIVTAQAIWETGWFTCTDCSLDKNNLFGFNTGGPYFKFDNWKESIDYYKQWQDDFYDPERDYYSFLACLYKDNNGRCLKYCENPESYIEALKGTIARHKNKWVANN